ncbi:zinc finger CCCH domain-containing protein 10-like [Atheta coriaria]|uniref:zinc finger CCCH domain-containing protein 10-like n=1 Tax=Dalotia coriaria TaxID=877792 RepID=UPI0031F3DC35
MSDTSEESSPQDGSHGCDSVCRDFLRGMCERQFCKYKHEYESRSLSFCHDFQNSSCPRQACKFIHCTPDEVDDYKRTGAMSIQVLTEATRKNQLPGIHPICNSFRKGTCRRTHCKYRHISKEEEDAEIMRLIKNNNRNHVVPSTPLVMDAQPTQIYESATILGRPVQSLEELDEYGPTAAKRRYISNGLDSPELHGLHCNRGFKGYFPGNPPQVLSRLDPRMLMLEEENSILHKEIAQLKKQVSDLTATNEFLLDQNATLRVSGKRNGSVSMPPVTLTNTLSQNSQGQVLRTVAASVATVPVSLATVTTCNPVSVGCPQVSIAPAAQILAPSQQILVTTNQSTQLALANSSQAQLAIAQQNLANNLAAQQAQPQLTSQAQQLALATTTQQLTSQAQQLANQQLALASMPQQTPQATIGSSQQIAQAQQAAQQLGQQLSNQAQQLNQQLTSQAQQLALAANNTQQQLTSQAQQLALASTALNTTQQLTSQAQQLALANTPQQLAVAANVSQQLALASTSQQLLAQQNLTPSQQIELHVGARGTQINGINTSQTLAMSNATAPMVSFPIMTHTLPH